MVCTLLSGPMVCALFPCFLTKWKHRGFLFALRPRGQVTDRERRGVIVVVYTLLFSVWGARPEELSEQKSEPLKPFHAQTVAKPTGPPAQTGFLKPLASDREWEGG